MLCFASHVPTGESVAPPCCIRLMYYLRLVFLCALIEQTVFGCSIGVCRKRDILSRKKSEKEQEGGGTIGIQRKSTRLHGRSRSRQESRAHNQKGKVRGRQEGSMSADEESASKNVSPEIGYLYSK